MRGDYLLQSGCSRAGLTLVEVLIVVAIASIVGLLAVPAGGVDADTRVRSAARKLIADLEYAQMRSTGDGADPWVVVFDPDADGYHLARQSDPGTPVTDPTTRGAYEVWFGGASGGAYRGVSIDSVTAGAGDRLNFDAWGGLSDGSNAVINLSSGGLTMQVVVDADTGTPTIP